MSTFALEQLRRNDPRVTSVRLALTDRFPDADITEALEQNPHIVCIVLNMYAFGPRNGPRLLQHLETRSNLHKVQIASWQNEVQAQIAIVLHALQRNTNVRDIQFISLHDGVGVPVGSLAPFLNAASHITDLSFGFAIENADDNIDGPSLLAASLQHMTNLQALTLYSPVQSEYLVAIFSALKRKPSLQTLALDFLSFSGAAWASFKNLMRITSTIRELEVFSLSARSKETFFNIVKSNFSLRVVRARTQFLFDGHFTEAEQRSLAFYADRNERMGQWIERPTSVPRQLHPEVLHVAAQAEPSVLFRSLLAIRDELGKRTRKRKRPAYFEPS